MGIQLLPTAGGGIRCVMRKRYRSPLVCLATTFFVGCLYSALNSHITWPLGHSCASHAEEAFHSRSLLQYSATTTTAPNNATHGKKMTVTTLNAQSPIAL